MPFNSESASLGGQKSKRGKSIATEVKKSNNRGCRRVN